MKFNTTDAPKFEYGDLIGNVYQCKGGKRCDHKYWVIVGQHKHTVICLGIDDEGNIVSSGNYGEHVFGDYPWSREPIGRVIDMPSMNFQAVWNKLI